MTHPHTPMRTVGPLLAAVAGLLFGLGLIAGGMTDPGKVQAFLDLGGRWDPSLAFVMGGALAVTALGMAWGRRRATAWSGEPLCQPPSRRLEARLVAGGVLFGAGWGLAGFCPGPAWVSAASGSGEALLTACAAARPPTRTRRAVRTRPARSVTRCTAAEGPGDAGWGQTPMRKDCVRLNISQ